MKVYIPEISWHEREPVYSCAFHPLIPSKFATASVTGTIRLWEFTESSSSSSSSNNNKNGFEVTFVSNLKRHTRPVCVVRWSSDGLSLASAGDEAVIFVWNENEAKSYAKVTLDNDDCENKENWTVTKSMRGHLEDILDLAWSKDNTMLISGSVDNSVIVWHVASGSKIALLKEPKGFVQGVAWDPMGAYFAALSTDRCLRIFSASSHKCLHNVNKINMSKEMGKAESKDKENKENEEMEIVMIDETKPAEGAVAATAQPAAPASSNIRMFYDDTLRSFYRRFSFSPDGQLLFAPAGCLELNSKINNTSYIFTRNSISKPSVYIPHDKPSMAISVCPVKFELIKKNESDGPDLINLPYRYVFAVGTEDSVFLYDTQSLKPFAYVTDIHYDRLSDLSWSENGRLLLVASIDGFCTFIAFKENELGKIYSTPTADQTPMCSQTTTTTTTATTKCNQSIVTDTVKVA